MGRVHHLWDHYLIGDAHRCVVPRESLLDWRRVLGHLPDMAAVGAVRGKILKEMMKCARKKIDQLFEKMAINRF